MKLEAKRDSETKSPLPHEPREDETPLLHNHYDIFTVTFLSRSFLIGLNVTALISLSETQ